MFSRSTNTRWFFSPLSDLQTQSFSFTFRISSRMILHDSSYILLSGRNPVQQLCEPDPGYFLVNAHFAVSGLRWVPARCWA